MLNYIVIPGAVMGVLLIIAIIAADIRSAG